MQYGCNEILHEPKSKASIVQNNFINLNKLYIYKINKFKFYKHCYETCNSHPNPELLGIIMNTLDPKQHFY